MTDSAPIPTAVIDSLERFCRRQFVFLKTTEEERLKTLAKRWDELHLPVLESILDAPDERTPLDHNREQLHHPWIDQKLYRIANKLNINLSPEGDIAKSGALAIWIIPVPMKGARAFLDWQSVEHPVIFLNEHEILFADGLARGCLHNLLIDLRQATYPSLASLPIPDRPLDQDEIIEQVRELFECSVASPDTVKAAYYKSPPILTYAAQLADILADDISQHSNAASDLWIEAWHGQHMDVPFYLTDPDTAEDAAGFVLGFIADAIGHEYGHVKEGHRYVNSSSLASLLGIENKPELDGALRELDADAGVIAFMELQSGKGFSLYRETAILGVLTSATFNVLREELTVSAAEPGDSIENRKTAEGTLFLEDKDEHVGQYPSAIERLSFRPLAAIRLSLGADGSQTPPPWLLGAIGTVLWVNLRLIEIVRDVLKHDFEDHTVEQSTHPFLGSNTVDLRVKSIRSRLTETEFQEFGDHDTVDTYADLETVFRPEFLDERTKRFFSKMDRVIEELDD
jgi:hypothetical protein